MTVADPASVLSAEQLAETYGRNAYVIARQVAGLSHADSVIQPPARGNCLNWVLGHIAVHRDYVLEALGEDKVLGDAAAARYGTGSAPILSADDEGVAPLETLIEAIDSAQEKIAAALNRATPADLARELPHDASSTVGGHALLLCWHESYHVGQTEFLRQLAGTDDHVI